MFPVFTPPAAAPTISRPTWCDGPPPRVEPAFVERPVARAHDERGADPMAELQRELDALRAEAMREGRLAGEQEAQAAAAAASGRLTALLGDLESARVRALAGAEEQLCELAVAIASVLVGDALRQDEILRPLVREAIELIGEADDIIVSVNERDLPVVRDEVDKLGETLSRRCRVRVKADAEIQQGCRVDTQLAHVDASLEGRLARVREALLGGGAQA